MPFKYYAQKNVLIANIIIFTLNTFDYILFIILLLYLYIYYIRRYTTLSFIIYILYFILINVIFDIFCYYILHDLYTCIYINIFKIHLKNNQTQLLIIKTSKK